MNFSNIFHLLYKNYKLKFLLSFIAIPKFLFIRHFVIGFSQFIFIYYAEFIVFLFKKLLGISSIIDILFVIVFFNYNVNYLNYFQFVKRK